jgi:hypothetical protein
MTKTRVEYRSQPIFFHIDAKVFVSWPGIWANQHILKPIIMDTIKKFDLMQKIVNELVDLQHSQQALIQKLGKIEVDNIELGDKRLEQDLPDMHQRVSDNLDTIGGILEYFADKTQNFSDKNNVDALKEQQIIDNLGN